MRVRLPDGWSDFHLMVARLPHPQAGHQFSGMMPPATVVPSTASVRDHVLAVLRANRGRPETAYGVRDPRCTPESGHPTWQPDSHIIPLQGSNMHSSGPKFGWPDDSDVRREPLPLTGIEAPA